MWTHRYNKKSILSFFPWHIQTCSTELCVFATLHWIKPRKSSRPFLVNFYTYLCWVGQLQWKRRVWCSCHYFTAYSAPPSPFACIRDKRWVTNKFLLDWDSYEWKLVFSGSGSGLKLTLFLWGGLGVLQRPYNTENLSLVDLLKWITLSVSTNCLYFLLSPEGPSSTLPINVCQDHLTPPPGLHGQYLRQPQFALLA